MKKMNRKSGFTLVELMVVAIIVAILAAVAIPLMTGNKERAAATEAQAGCSTIATAQRMAKAQYGSYTNAASVTDLPGLNAGDLNGTYFNDGSYALSGVGANTFTITATPRSGAPDGIDSSKTVTLTVSTDGSSSWGGDLLK